MGFGDRLKEERDRLGHNQQTFASLVGVSKNTQYNYEKGDRSPDVPYLAVAASLGVDVLYVVTGERRPQPADSITAEEAQVLNFYRDMPAEDRGVIRRMSHALAESATQVQKKSQ